MRKLITLFFACALQGCGSSGITCDTPEVKQTEANMFGGVAEGMRVDKVTQFTNKQTGATSCRVSISFDKDGHRQIFLGDGFIFALVVADDNENFTVTLLSMPKGFEYFPR